MKINLPSSQGGLNLRDSLDSMPERDCIQMDNLIPDVGADKLRRGNVPVSTQRADDIFAYNVYNNNKLLVVDQTIIYDLDLVTGIRTQLNDGYATREWTSSLFTDAGGTVNLMLANGINPVQKFDGTTLGDSGYTGASNLRNPKSFKNRMYFVEDGTFNVWYGGVQAIAGALTKFPVDNFFSRGGEISMLGQWTQDGGVGTDDQFVIISTEGEVLIYSGLSPESESWALKGRYNIPKPIGNKSSLEQGGDIILVTEQGVMPLSVVLSQDRANNVAVSDKVNEAFKDPNKSKNWSIHFYSKEGWYLINKPSTTSYKYEQLVLNFKTLGWCRFVGMDALNWAILGDDIYFCNLRGVNKANTSNKDGDLKITYYKQPAYTRLNMRDLKQVIQVKPRFGDNRGSLEINRRIGVDFKIGDAGLSKSIPSGNQAIWDEALYDVDFWTDEFKVSSFKTSAFSPMGDFISVGFFGETDEETSFSSTETKILTGKGEVW